MSQSVTKDASSFDKSNNFNAYVLSIEELKRAFEKANFNNPNIQKFLNYVPMGTNYLKNPLNSDCSEQSNSITYENLVIKFLGEYEVYFNSKLTLKEHIDQKYLHCLYYVVVHPWFFEELTKMQMEDLRLFSLRYQRCVYDENKSQPQTYHYPMQIKDLKKLIESTNPWILELLETIPLRGYATSEKKSGVYVAGTYEEMYKSTMSLGEHIKMYLRDQNICNFNTVNYGISYCVDLSQNQVDFLIKAAKENSLLNKYELIIILDNTTTSPITCLSDREHFHQKYPYEREMITRSQSSPTCIIA